MITYNRSGDEVLVYLDDKHVGSIKRLVINKYQYVTKCGNKGEVFRSIDEVKQSLEGEN